MPLKSSSKPGRPLPKNASAHSKRKRVNVLISGRGSNLAALIAASMKPDYPAIITQVISSRADAKGLETAKANGIATKVIARRDFASDDDHEAAIMAAIDADKAQFVCLAGFMRILSARFVRHYRGKILNIHPSLLPAFKGLDTHHRALSHGVRIHGCTVHYVNEDMDEGPIIAQACVPVLPDDDADTLAARVLESEHKLYPAVLRHVAEGNVRLSANHAVVKNVDAVETFSLTAPFDGETIAR